KMTGVLQDDSPWVWGFHPVAFTLAHRWIYNLKPNPMVNNGVKYIRLDPEKRASLREDWNSPVVWPVFVLLAVVFAASIPAVISLGKKMGLTGR
ncbi:MAG TPA: peptide ABC transporter substrate-binding protein, partial [Thermodesulfobacteriota bacterium]|nr:peptide ABC transporter substrate-binding protein [Thermodesulfobacteriota bacterium]